MNDDEYGDIVNVRCRSLERAAGVIGFLTAKNLWFEHVTAKRARPEDEDGVRYYRMHRSSLDAFLLDTGTMAHRR